MGIESLLFYVSIVLTKYICIKSRTSFFLIVCNCDKKRNWSWQSETLYECWDVLVHSQNPTEELRAYVYSPHSKYCFFPLIFLNTSVFLTLKQKYSFFKKNLSIGNMRKLLTLHWLVCLKRELFNSWMGTHGQLATHKHVHLRLIQKQRQCIC